MDKFVVLKCRGQNTLVNPLNVTYVEGLGAAFCRIYFTSKESIEVEHDLATTRAKLQGS